MKQIIIKVLLIAAVVSPLAACKKKSRTSPPVSTPTPQPPGGSAFEDQFGTGFGAIFRKAAWSEPVDPKPGDVIPVSADRDPVNF